MPVGEGGGRSGGTHLSRRAIQDQAPIPAIRRRLRARGARRRPLSLRTGKTISGVVPGATAIARLSDDEIIARLTAVRGVGKWTVEMLLIFTLGRHDIWPVDDFGVRAGWKIVYGLDDMPAPKELQALGEKFQPHRSVAAWYFRRATDLNRSPAD